MDRVSMRNVIITVVLMIGLTYVGYIYLLSPKAKEVKKLKREIARVDKEITKAKKAQRRAETLKREVAKMEQKLEELKAILPTAEEMPILIREVSKQGYYNRITFDLFKPGKEKIIPEQRYAALDINLEFKTSYPQLVSLMRGISQLERLIKPTSLSIKTKQFSSENPLLDVKCTLETYRYVAGSEKGGTHGGKSKKRRK